MAPRRQVATYLGRAEADRDRLAAATTTTTTKTTPRRGNNATPESCALLRCDNFVSSLFGRAGDFIGAERASVAVGARNACGRQLGAQSFREPNWRTCERLHWRMKERANGSANQHIRIRRRTCERCLFVLSLARSFVRSFVGSFVRSFVRSLACPLGAAASETRKTF